jgi:hypothetical protein
LPRGDSFVMAHGPAARAIIGIPRARTSQRVADDVSWFRVTKGCLEYRGRITRAPFVAWTETKPGREAVERAARGIRFSLFGRRNAARKRMWRGLEAASRDGAFDAAIRAEAARYMELLAAVAYADALPRANVALHRLVLAPRAMISGRAHTAISQRLGQAPALAALDEAVRAFLLERLVIEMDEALKKASPSPKRPVLARDGWACVGISVGMVWVDSLWAGRDGTGHVFLYEFPRDGLPRRDRKALEAAIAQMGTSVSTLSRMQRGALVRAASLR